ncbi:metal ABC transporter substrate-binding protein [Synechococcus sp. CS-1328]|uniref:metal ABC transporter substrate-binding protein n=1 Tax=Synechococcus sp. CS-1328 TaxID=2847976 RepID=UPI00223B2539|nr:metal ABC transporter substrate-binding protein [Synechococcus sp. CS-1328]
MALPLLLLLAACTAPSQDRPQGQVSAGSPSASEGRPLVLTTFTVLADMARNVAGDRLEVASITKVGSEIHHYEPTPSDLRRAQGAVMVLENGFNLERWSQRFTDTIQGARRVVVSQGIDPLPIRSDGLEPASSTEPGKPNPHAWMSPSRAQHYVDTIRDAFIDLDPAGATTYRRNAEAYKLKLAQLDQDLRRSLASVPPNQRMLVTCEGAFSYLARDYGLQEGYLWPVNGEGEATPRRQARLSDEVRRRKVPAVFCESTVSDKSMRQLAAASGARFGGTFYVDSLSESTGPAPSLLELQRHNVDLIVKGLTNG